MLVLKGLEWFDYLIFGCLLDILGGRLRKSYTLTFQRFKPFCMHIIHFIISIDRTDSLLRKSKNKEKDRMGPGHNACCSQQILDLFFVKTTWITIFHERIGSHFKSRHCLLFIMSEPTYHSTIGKPKLNPSNDIGKIEDDHLRTTTVGYFELWLFTFNWLNKVLHRFCIITVFVQILRLNFKVKCLYSAYATRAHATSPGFLFYDGIYITPASFIIYIWIQSTVLSTDGVHLHFRNYCLDSADTFALYYKSTLRIHYSKR